MALGCHDARWFGTLIGQHELKIGPGLAMDRLNHVKIVTPDPEAVRRFLTEVLDIPDGWSLGETSAAAVSEFPSPARDAAGRFSAESVQQFRGSTGGGLMVGSTESRQFQVLEGQTPHIWGVAVGTRHLERAHQRCVEARIPCTDPALTSSQGAGIRFFFAEVGGVVFEVVRAESEDGGELP
jgi:catechol 2,3-dioxygenase-like lactoylglutathione lyase family enzyme